MSSGWYQSPQFFSAPAPRRPRPVSPPTGESSGGRGPRGAGAPVTPADPWSPPLCLHLPPHWRPLKKLAWSLEVGGFRAWKPVSGAVGVGGPPREQPLPGGSRWLLAGGWLRDRAVIHRDCVRTHVTVGKPRQSLPLPPGAEGQGRAPLAEVQAGDPFRRSWAVGHRPLCRTCLPACRHLS